MNSLKQNKKGVFVIKRFLESKKAAKPIVEGTKHDDGFIGFEYCDELCSRCGEYTHNIPVDRVSLCAYCQAEIIPCTCCEDDCDFSREKNSCHRFKYFSN